MSATAKKDIFIGIDLGSTTTKAVILDDGGEILGRGITNSRSNYDVACRIAREEAFIRARFSLAENAMRADPLLAGLESTFIRRLEDSFKLHQYLGALEHLRAALQAAAGNARHFTYQADFRKILNEVVDEMVATAPALFKPGASRKSDFFRDLAGAEYMQLAEKMADPKGINFETIVGAYDSAILTVENTSDEESFKSHIGAALDLLLENGSGETTEQSDHLRAAIETARTYNLNELVTVGTGYGRQRLPFPKEWIRSEILCHGLGAHAMFPDTATVLDIGGQDTKAIQVDDQGIVTSFQMNDRCAAGCGRYLGYIADEMNLGLHELGPLAQKSTHRVKINSTCTVFAGAELRDRLGMGQRREDILAGLHRAIMLRAMSLLARSGGVKDEFTFTGGVANNPAAVDALVDLIQQNYGSRKLNISPDSIYTGALGGALFAMRDYQGAQA
jgi:benzoyl-CoA reductase subunit A